MTRINLSVLLFGWVWVPLAAAQEAPIPASEPAREAIRAMVQAGVDSVLAGDPGAVETLVTWSRLGPAYQSDLRDIFEIGNLRGALAEQSSSPSPQAQSQQAQSREALLARVEALGHYAGFAEASSLAVASKRREQELKPNAVQWLTLASDQDNGVLLEFSDCAPMVHVFAVTNGSVGARTGGAVAFLPGLLQVNAADDVALRLDSSACEALPTSLVTQTVAVEAMPVDGHLALDRVQVVDMSAVEGVALNLSTRAGRIYEIFAAAAGSVDPSLQVFVEGQAEPVAQDDDGAGGLNARISGVMGMGEALRVQLSPVSAVFGPVHTLVREVTPIALRVGEEKTLAANPGSGAFATAKLETGVYNISAVPEQEGLDPVLSVQRLGNVEVVAENDDRAEGDFSSLACLQVTDDADFVVTVRELNGQQAGIKVVIVRTDAESCE